MTEMNTAPSPHEAHRPTVLPLGTPSQGEVRPQTDILPIVQHERPIKEALQTHDQIIIVGQTGSGKTTVVPRYIHEVVSQQDPDAKIIVTQPRRFATEDTAQYVGSFLPKGMVGYRHKYANTITDGTKINFMVDRSLLNELRRDPLLNEYAAVMIDEVHERSIDTDIEMALLKEAQMKRKQLGLRPLKLVVASATLDKQKLASYFSHAAQFDIAGRMFEVADHFANSPIERENLPTEAAKKASQIIENPQSTGDILIFMPGRGEINKTMAELKNYIPDDTVECIPFFGEQNSQDQNRIYKNTGKRKIIIATNVAETSITIKTVKNVIDGGLMKVNIYDPRTGISSLQVLEHTKSNWKQRKGRAGRVTEGDAYYLFTKEQLDAREDFPDPQIHRENLTELVLKMKNMGIDNIQDFDFLDQPKKENIAMAISTLQQLGALDNRGTITEIGRQMEEIPLDPHYARMLIEAKKRGCVEPVSVLISFLNNKPVFAYNPKEEKFTKKYREFLNPHSDFLTLLTVWNTYVQHNISRENNFAWTEAKGLNRNSLYEIGKEKNDIIGYDYVQDQNIPKQHRPFDLGDPRLVDAIQKSILTGFIDQVLIKQSFGTYTQQNGRKSGIKIDRSSGFAEQQPDVIVAGNIRSLGEGEREMTHASYIQRTDKQEIAAVRKNIETDSLLMRSSTERQHASPLPSVPSLASTTAELQNHTKRSFWKKLWRFFRS